MGFEICLCYLFAFFACYVFFLSYRNCLVGIRATVCLRQEYPSHLVGHRGVTGPPSVVSEHGLKPEPDLFGYESGIRSNWGRHGYTNFV